MAPLIGSATGGSSGEIQFSETSSRGSSGQPSQTSNGNGAASGASELPACPNGSGEVTIEVDTGNAPGGASNSGGGANNSWGGDAELDETGDPTSSAVRLAGRRAVALLCWAAVAIIAAAASPL